MTTAELADAERVYREARTQLEADLGRAREARDDAIRQAVADGMSYRQVAAATELSHSRVAQIVTAQEVTS